MKQVKATVAGVLVAASIGATSMAQTNAPQAVVPKTWADNVTVKGDIRYRYESIDDDSKLNSKKETYTRERERIRARLTVDAKCNDNVKACVELSTGQADPVSGNQSIGDGFNKKDFKLNLAYLEYDCLLNDPNSLRFAAGKIKNPFSTTPEDLVWDGDLTHEGISARSQFSDGIVTFMANGGYMWIQERSDKADSMLYAGQAAMKFEFMPEVSLTIGGSSYSFKNLEGYDVIDWESKNGSYGNSTKNGTVSGSTTNKAWKYEYAPVVYFAQVDLWMGTTPVALYVQDMSNGEVSKDGNGQLYGIRIGRAKNPSSWEIGYSYAEIEKDATVGAYTDSDRWGGGTDGEGHKLSAKYQFQKNLQAGVTYFMDNKRKISTGSKATDYDRLQVDLIASF